MLVTKVGAILGPQGSWDPAFSASDITRLVHDNLRSLGIDTLEVVNLRVMFNPLSPVGGSIAAPLSALLKLQREGKVRHIGSVT